MSLTDEQVNTAFNDLVIKFPKVERLPVDPPLAGQNYGLFSFKFLPQPKNGVYGFLKFRGAFPSESDWVAHAKNIIRTVDSKHKIWPYEQGRWMPITDNEAFCKEILDVKQQEDIKESFNTSETEEQKKEIKAAKDIKDRQRKLLEESRAPADTSSLDYYAQQIMKMEQTESWLETIRKRRRDFITSLKNTRDEILRLDALHPEYKDMVQEKIKSIKEEIGLDGNSGPPRLE